MNDSPGLYGPDPNAQPSNTTPPRYGYQPGPSDQRQRPLLKSTPQKYVSQMRPIAMVIRLALSVGFGLIVFFMFRSVMAYVGG